MSHTVLKIICIVILFQSSLFAQAENLSIEADVSLENGPRLKLVLNEEYLITHLLAKKVSAQNLAAKDVIAVQKLALKMDPTTYRQFQNYKDPSIELTTSPIFLSSFATFFNRIKQTTEYKLIKKQTIDYMNVSLLEWNQNLEKSTVFIKKYSGFNFNYSVTVYITHPAVGNGEAQNIQEKIIAFGAKPTFNNYFTVYIWHEIIHLQMNLDKTSHAANQLLTDNDLRVFLNGDHLFPLQGHQNLIGIMKKNLKKWAQYKKSPSNLNIFVKNISAKK